MKYVSQMILGVLTIAPLASASTICTTGTLAAYEALGSGGCTIGTDTVSGFNVPSGITGATPIAPSLITIAPSGGTTNPSLTFSFSATASNGALLEALIDYSVAGNSFTSDSITLSGVSSSGNGAVTEIQNYCIGGTFNSTGVNNCSSGRTGDLLLLGSGSDSVSFAASPGLNVTHDFTLDSGGTGSATGGTVTDAFVAAAATPGVPEPATFSLMAALAVGAFVKFRVGLTRKEN